MLKRLYVDNYRCLVNFELNVPKLAVILGANGSGKSSVWEVMLGVQQLIADAELASVAFEPDSLTLWQPRRTQRVELDLAGPHGAYRYALELAHEDERRRVRVASETVSLDGNTLYRCEDGMVSLFGGAQGAHMTTTFPFDRHRSFLGVIEPRKEDSATIWFVEWFRRMVVLQPDPMLMPSVSDVEEEMLDTDGENFASWYRSVLQSNPEAVTRALDDLREVLVGFRTLRLEKAGEARVLKGRFAAPEGGEYDVAFHDLSHGQRTAILLYVLAYVSSESSLLFLDEPENYLALPEIQPWLARLRQLTDDTGAQALIISHHPEIIDYLAPSDALLFTREDGGPTRVGTLDVDREAGLTASQWWARGLADAES